MRSYSLALAVCLLTLVGGCKKKDPEPPTRTQLLVGKKWQLRSGILSYPGANDADFYAQMRACSHDDYRQFDLPNTSAYDEGSTKCSVLDPQRQLGLWALSNDGTQLTITDSSTSDTYTIVELTDTTLKMTIPVPQASMIDATATVVYSVVK